MKETLEKAVELIGYGRELPDDEAIGVSVGWWPCFASPSGAYVKLNPDGTGTIITGAQENGTGAVMAMPKYVAEQLGMQPEDFSLLYQDTDAAPSDMGSCGSQTTFNSGRAVIAAAVDLREQLLDAAAEELEAAKDDLELRDGAVLVKGSPDKSITIAKLASGLTFSDHFQPGSKVPSATAWPASWTIFAWPFPSNGRVSSGESNSLPQLPWGSFRRRLTTVHPPRLTVQTVMFIRGSRSFASSTTARWAPGRVRAAAGPMIRRQKGRQRALDVDRVGEAAAALGRLDQVAVAHAGAGQAGLVGEEAPVLELDHVEAQAQAGAEDDLRLGTLGERAVELARLISAFHFGQAAASA